MSKQYINRVNGIPIQDTKLTEKRTFDKLVRDNVEHIIGHISKETLVLEYDMENPTDGTELTIIKEPYTYFVGSKYYSYGEIKYEIRNIDLSVIKYNIPYKIIINDEIIDYFVYTIDWDLWYDNKIYHYIDPNADFKNMNINNYNIEMNYDRNWVSRMNCLLIKSFTKEIEVADATESYIFSGDEYEFKTIKIYELKIDDENDLSGKYIKNDKSYNFTPTGNYLDLLFEEIGKDYELKLDMFVLIPDKITDRKSLVSFSKPQNIIVDYGDGVIEEFTGISKIEHTYAESGKYNVKVYSNEYLYINGGYDNRKYYEFNKLDLSQHTEIVDTIMPYYCTLNCDISVSSLCTKLEWAFSCVYFIDNIDFIDFSNIVSLDNAFDGMSSLNHLPSNWDTSKVKIWDYAFQQTESLTRVENLDLSAATSIEGLFYVSNVEYLCPINIPNVRNLIFAFQNMCHVKNINMTSSNITNINGSFSYCYDLKTIQTLDLGDISTSVDSKGDYIYIHNVFDLCQSLEYVKFSGTIPAATLDIVLNHLPAHDDTVRRVADISLCDNKDGVTATVAGWEISKEAVEYWGEGIE